MLNSTTHYQTSFCVVDSNGKTMTDLKGTVFGWLCEKEHDARLRAHRKDFFFRCDWQGLSLTRSQVSTRAFLCDGGGAWALRYTEVDKGVGAKRFWYSDIGLRQGKERVIVSTRISFAWNKENLSHIREEPAPNVPKVMRYLLKDHRVYSGRKELRLIPNPIKFDRLGMGKVLWEFIENPERRYPIIVFNGDSDRLIGEANSLARELAGKCQVVVIADNPELAEEIRHYVPSPMRIIYGQFRVYFPFNNRANDPTRHRYYDTYHSDYKSQRAGVINGLLRNHILAEPGAVESIEDVVRLVAHQNVLKMSAGNPQHQKELEEFLVEHTKVAAERDQARNEAAVYVNEVDQLEGERKELIYKIQSLQTSIEAMSRAESHRTDQRLRRLPECLVEWVKLVPDFFPNLVLTHSALKSAEDYPEFSNFAKVWEMLDYLNSEIYGWKFDCDEGVDWVREVNDKTNFSLAMSEGKQTQNDKRLMQLRQIQHDGKFYDVTPHLKYGSQFPKMIRIHFAFDEPGRKIVLGYIGSHMENATTRTLK